MKSKWFLFVAAVAGGLALYAIFLHQTYTWRGNTHPDFYIEWMGSRVALQGGNPYGEETTLAIQVGSKGHPVKAGEDQLAFVYPFYRVFLNAPIAFLPYDWATAWWQAAMQGLLIVGGLLFVRGLGWQASAWDLALVLLGTVLAYPTFGGLMLGQMAVGVLACLLIAYWAVERGHDRFAGCCLAWATVKPHLALLPLLFVLLWSLSRRRWRVLWSFALTLGLLIVVSLVIFPAWPGEFLRGIAHYPSYKPVRTGPGFLFMEAKSPVWPALLEVAVGVWLLASWWAAIRRDGQGTHRWRDGAFVLTLALTAFWLPLTSVVNQMMLLPTVLLLMRDAPNRAVRLALAGLWIVGTWLAYALLYRSHYGWNMSLPPLLVLLALGFWFVIEVKKGERPTTEPI